MLALLRTFSWQELRHHPWRNAAAVVAVMLGVALAFSVHLINASALGEFSSAVRAVNGQPDLELRSVQGNAGRVAVRPRGHPSAGGAGQPGAGVVHLRHRPQTAGACRCAWWAWMR
jgi:putative ABC transport system permease protein